MDNFALHVCSALNVFNLFDHSSAKYAVGAIKKKMFDPNPHVAQYALTVSLVLTKIFSFKIRVYINHEFNLRKITNYIIAQNFRL